MPFRKQINNLLLYDGQCPPHPSVFLASAEVKTQWQWGAIRHFLIAFYKIAAVHTGEAEMLRGR